MERLTDAVQAACLPWRLPAFAYRFAMCLGPDGELMGQVSINELLVAMGEDPVENFILTGVPDDISSLSDDPPPLPGL